MHFEFGKPVGRYLGQYGKYHVYSGSISEVPPEGTGDIHEYTNAPGEFNFQYGPSSGGMIESVGFSMATPGELIKSVSVEAGYKTRNILLKGQDLQTALLRVERINGFHASSHAIGFLMALEDALGIEVSDEVGRARVFQLELERIRSNLEVMKRMCEPAGFGVPANQIGYLREKVSRIISRSSGHRFFFGANGPGSAKIDNSGANMKIREVQSEFQRIFRGLLESKIFLNRLQGNGTTHVAHMTGPSARASGMRHDSRADSSLLPYADTPFYPVVRDEADCFGRFNVRGEEILNSCDVLASLGNIGQTPVQEPGNGEGQGSARLESPQGDIFYYVSADGGSISDIWFVTPGTLNLEAFRESMKGNIFTDFHFNWESFGIWISELGVAIQ